jgi:O-antigen/teichoic acid export membrane protein
MKLRSSAMVYAAGGAVVSALPILLIPLLTRLLTPAEYGVTAMFSSALVVLGAFTGLSVHGAITVRYFEKPRVDIRAYVVSCLAIVCVSVLPILVIVIVATPALQTFTKIPAIWIPIAVIASGAQSLTQILLALRQAEQRAWSFTAVRAGQAILDLGLTLVFVAAFRYGAYGRMGGIASASILMIPVVLYLLYRGGLLGSRPSRTYVFDALRFGVPLVPHTLGTMLVFMSDRYIVSNLLGIAVTGVYVLSMQFTMILNLAADSINRALAPWLLERLGSVDDLRDQLIVKRTYAYFALAFLVCVAFGALSPYVLRFVVGARFHVQHDVMIYLSIGAAFSAMYYMVTNYVFYGGRTGTLALITFGGGAVSVTATWTLVSWNGVVGAAQGFMIAQLFIFLATWRLAQRARPMPWNVFKTCL